MKVLGIDPSSSLSGGAVVDRKGLKKAKLLKTMLWKRNERRSHPWNLMDWVDAVRTWCREEEPDVAVVESLSVSRNAKTTRAIAFYQAAAVIGCKLEGIPVIETQAKRVRMIVLEDGNMDKETAHKAIKKMFPGHKFKIFKAGGGDETDAACLAVAGPDAVED